MKYCWFCPTIAQSTLIAEISINDVLQYARIILDNDPCMDHAPVEEGGRFNAIFGIPAELVLMLWLMLEEFDFSPINGTMIHFLRTLMEKLVQNG